jgi:peptidoglycan-N-acetylglucosamine deacetylase
MRLFRPIWPFRIFYPEALFRIKTKEKVLYLTFDDGPDSEVTFPLLRILSDNAIRAVFFCSGRSVSENPELIQAIKSGGHTIGNHGYDHINGCDTPNDEYIENVSKASAFTSHNLFRPPYGRMKHSQYLTLKKDYRIILWDIMPYDFDQAFGPEHSFSVLKKHIRPGSVIVLHDRKGSTVLEFLEQFIVFAKIEGYIFRLLTDDLIQSLNSNKSGINI